MPHPLYVGQTLTLALAPSVSANYTAIVDAVNDLDNKNTRDHILQDKHHWHKLVPNPQDPDNWHKIAAIITQTMAYGKSEPHGSAFARVMGFGGEVVRVTYQIVNGVIRISNAWVQN